MWVCGWEKNTIITYFSILYCLVIVILFKLYSLQMLAIFETYDHIAIGSGLHVCILDIYLQLILLPVATPGRDMCILQKVVD